MESPDEETQLPSKLIFNNIFTINRIGIQKHKLMLLNFANHSQLTICQFNF